MRWIQTKRSSVFFEDPLPWGARAYILSVITLGSVLFVYCLVHSLARLDLRWVLLATLAFVASFFPVKIPLIDEKKEKLAITMGDALIFTSMLLFGPEVAALMGAVEGFTTNSRARVRRLYRRLFNLAQFVLVAFIVGHIFYILEGQSPPLDPNALADPGKLLVLTGLCGLIYFALNTGAVALAMSLATRRSLFDVWTRNFLWVWITHFAGASLGAILFLCFQEVRFYFIALAVPTVLLIHYAYKMNLERIQQAQGHLEQVSELLEREIEIQRALEESKQQLETKVHERTRELWHSNQRLLSEIMERKAAEKALAAEKKRLSVTLQSIGEGVITTDTAGKIFLVNRVAEDLTGWKDEEARNQFLMDVFKIVDRKTGRRCEDPGEVVLRTAKTLLPTSKDVVLVSRHGTEHRISYSAAPIAEKEGRAAGVVVVFRDITDYLRVEEELIRADKLESLGVLAGGIAHDFNNVLAGILLKTQLAERSVMKGKNPRKFLASVQEAAQRAADLNQQLLTFARGGAPITRPISIVDLLKQSAFFALTGSRVGANFRIPKDLWAVKADEGQISQVINNLVINAEQSMPEGGLITVHAENVRLEKGTPGPELSEGPYVKISIVDEGVGIPPEHLPRIFDPYFTTKPQGNGLGLASVFSILKRHGGCIRADSKMGAGSTFTFHLPASEVAPLDVPKASDDLKAGSGRILVMDDEEIVLDGTGEILEDLGYEVDFARNGAEAVHRYKKALKDGRPYAAVLMDLTIPAGMGGKEAIRKLLKIDPAVTAIVFSGYSQDPVMANYSKYGFKGVLAKPFTLAQLTRALEEVRGGAAQSVE